jgi:hypothetical protein
MAQIHSLCLMFTLFFSIKSSTSAGGEIKERFWAFMGGIAMQD